MADPKKPSAEIQQAAHLLMETHFGTAMMGAFILSILKKKGLLEAEEIAAAIRDAASQIPASAETSARLAPLATLKLTLDDAALRHTAPFEWPPAVKKSPG